MEVNELSTFSPGCVPARRECDLLRAKVGHDIGRSARSPRMSTQRKISCEKNALLGQLEREQGDNQTGRKGRAVEESGTVLLLAVEISKLPGCLGLCGYPGRLGFVRNYEGSDHASLITTTPHHTTPYHSHYSIAAQRIVTQ
jgi:hypothetical protein